MPDNFVKNLVKKYLKEPYLDANEVVEWEKKLKEHKIKKNEACLFIDIQYKALNKKQRKKELPRVLLDILKLSEKADNFDKIMNLTARKNQS